MRGRLGKSFSKLTAIERYVFFAVPPSKVTIGLFEWEIPKLKMNAKKLSIALRIVPANIIWNKIGETAIVTFWNLDHDDCPFLSRDNKCKIYEDRPLVCQTYPLFSDLLLSDKSRITELTLGDCPNAVNLPFMDGKHMLRFNTIFSTLLEVYGSVFLGSLRYNWAGRLYHQTLMESLEKRIIRPAKMRRKIKRAILKSKPIGLFDFLEAENSINKHEIQSKIQEIYDLSLSDLLRIAKHIHSTDAIYTSIDNNHGTPRDKKGGKERDSSLAALI